MPALDHVFVIVMENHAYGQIIGSPYAPYINGLLASGSLLTNYYAVAHPSLPNYLALTGGSTYGIGTDCTTCWISAANIADRVETAGKTWRTYQESMPSACFVGDSYPYVQKHDPFIYFNDIRTSAARCQSHVVPFSNLSTDLSSRSTTPNFAFITPNAIDDMHDGTIAQGDAWLGQHVPQILASPAFTTQRSLLLLTWDEDDFTNVNQVATIALGSGVTASYRSTRAYNHYSLLRTAEDALGLQTIPGGNDVSATAMNDVFALANWSRIGGVAASGPAAASWGSNRLDVFIRGTDDALWHRWWDGALWSAWESLGGILTADPAAASQGVNSLDVFVRGTDNAIWHRAWNGSTWSWWDSLGGIATSRPAAASSAPGRLDLVVEGTDDGLWHRGWNGSTWSWWDSAGGIATSEPALTASGPERVDVVVRGTDNGLWRRSWNGSTWSAWDSAGGIATSNPAVSSCSAGHLDVFVIGTDGSLWQRGFIGTAWTAWSSVGGVFPNGAGAVCPPGSATVQLVEVAPDLALIHSSAAGS